MKVSELIEALKKMPQDADVYCLEWNASGDGTEERYPRHPEFEDDKRYPHGKVIL